MPKNALFLYKIVKIITP